MVEWIPRLGYDYPTTAEVLAGGHQKGSGFNKVTKRQDIEERIHKSHTISNQDILEMLAEEDAANEKLLDDLFDGEGRLRDRIRELEEACRVALDAVKVAQTANRKIISA